MAVNDLATRAYNHAWAIDPIIRSVLDTDFYKLLMAQSILRHFPRTQVTFGLINRSRRVRLAATIPEGALREQLDHVRACRCSRQPKHNQQGQRPCGQYRRESRHALVRAVSG